MAKTIDIEPEDRKPIYPKGEPRPAYLLTAMLARRKGYLIPPCKGHNGWVKYPHDKSDSGYRYSKLWDVREFPRDKVEEDDTIKVEKKRDKHRERIECCMAEVRRYQIEAETSGRSLNEIANGTVDIFNKHLRH